MVGDPSPIGAIRVLEFLVEKQQDTLGIIGEAHGEITSPLAL